MKSNISMEIIVSACNDTKTVSEIKHMLKPYKDAKLVVYEKCGSTDYDNIPLDNVGREQHTFAYHVSKNYDSLSDKVICTAGNFDKHPRRRHFLADALSDTSSDFKCSSNFPGQSLNVGGHANFVLPLTPANPRPLSEWSRQHLGVFDPERTVCYEGMFKTSASTIRKRPQTDYDRVTNELSVSSDPEAGHYMERLQGVLYDSQSY